MSTDKIQRSSIPLTTSCFPQQHVQNQDVLLTNLLMSEAIFNKPWRACKGLRGSSDQIHILHKELKDLLENNSNRPESWVSNIKKLAFELEDLMEMHQLEIEYRKKTSLMQRLVSLWEHNLGVAPSIGTIKGRIQSLKNNMHRFEPPTKFIQHQRSMKKQMPLFRESTPYSQDLAVGLEMDTDKLVRFELIGKDGNQLRSVCIVGMAGIGKTTFAGKLYTHTAIRDHFECRLWVPIGWHFNSTYVFIAILQMLNLDPKKGMQVEELRKMVYKTLQSKRYLVVLDDVWKQEDWEDLKPAFPESNRGSRLVLTTHNSQLHTYSSGIFYQMKTLNLKQSKELFRRKAHISMEDKVQVQDIQEKLVEICGGLPLAIVVIGTILKKESRREQWKRVYKDLASLKGDWVEDIYKIFDLGYDNLPPDLRSCFLRVAFFPKGVEISARDLIYLWESHGLLFQDHHHNGENHGNTHLDALIGWNMIQAAGVSSDGKVVKKCKIHPLLHAFLASKAKKELFFQTQPSDQIRHIALCRSTSSSSCRVDKAPQLRSLLSFSPPDILPKILPSVCLYSKLLTVLYLKEMTIQKLPDAIGFLRNLRYLNICNTQILYLPQTVRFLLRLITLDARKNPKLTGISTAMKLENLQNLHIDDSLEPLRIKPSSHLCTLGKVRLQHIDWNNMASSKKLKTLKVSITDSCRCDELQIPLDEMISLVCLKLYIKTKLPSLPSEIFGKMNNLKTFHLKGHLTRPSTHSNIADQFHVPIEELEGLPHLSTLILQSICSAENEWLISGGGFRELVYLELSDVRNLKWLGVREGQSGAVMPKLEKHRFSDCPELKVQSEVFQSLSAVGM